MLHVPPSFLWLKVRAMIERGGAFKDFEPPSAIFFITVDHVSVPPPPRH